MWETVRRHTNLKIIFLNDSWRCCRSRGDAVLIERSKFLGGETQRPPLRASLTAFTEGSTSRKGRVKGKGGTEEGQPRGGVYRTICVANTLRIEQFWIVDASRISPSVLEPRATRSIRNKAEVSRCRPSANLSLSALLPSPPLPSHACERSAASHEIGALSHI